MNKEKKALDNNARNQRKFKSAMNRAGYVRKEAWVHEKALAWCEHSVSQYHDFNDFLSSLANDPRTATYLYPAVLDLLRPVIGEAMFSVKNKLLIEEGRYVSEKE